VKPTFFRLKRHVIEVSKITRIDLKPAGGGVVHLAGDVRGATLNAQELDHVYELINALHREGTVIARCAPDVKE